MLSCFADNEQLARSGTNCLENLVVSNGSQFSSEMWQRACRCIQDIFTSTVPSELLTWRPETQTTGTPTPESTPTHTPGSPVRTPDRQHSFDTVSLQWSRRIFLMHCRRQPRICRNIWNVWSYGSLWHVFIFNRGQWTWKWDQNTT